MSLYIDVKYALRLSSRLEHFKRKKENLWNCRCPLCGDSTQSKSKARGYIYRDLRDPSRLSFKCHNCGVSVLLATLIKKIDPTLYNEYKFERFRNPEQTQKDEEIKKDTPKYIDLSNHAIPCAELSTDHPCTQYLRSRMIPKEFYGKLYYTDNYAAFIQDVFPQEQRVLHVEARLIIPYFSKDLSLLAVTGRALSDQGIRYITIRADEQGPKLIFGLERMNPLKRVYITEGPLDSFFLPNAVASGDSNLIAVAERLIVRDVVLVYDNERRNKEIVHQMEKAIRDGYRIVVWPESIEYKDINQMIQNGMSPAQILEIIDTHTTSGLGALCKIQFWKKLSNNNQRSIRYASK